MSEHIDGEEEKYEPLFNQAKTYFAKLTRAPIAGATIKMLEWLARESFRAGYQHAHSRTTVRDDLWPDEEVKK